MKIYEHLHEKRKSKTKDTCTMSQGLHIILKLGAHIVLWVEWRGE